MEIQILYQDMKIVHFTTLLQMYNKIYKKIKIFIEMYYFSFGNIM